MENKQGKTAVYCRVACESQQAIEMQECILRVYAREHGISDDVVVYADNGFAGVNDARPAYRKMMEDIRAGTINTVVVRSISRLHRSIVNFSDWFDEMRSIGIRFIAVDNGFDTVILREEGC